MKVLCNLSGPNSKFGIYYILIIFAGFISSTREQPPIELVDIYQMLCFLLDIEPEKNDGIWDRIRNLLKNSSVSVRSSVVLILASVLMTYTYH